MANASALINVGAKQGAILMKRSLIITLAIVHASLLAGIGTLLILQHQDREILDNKFRVLAVDLADQQTRIEALQQTHDAALKQLGASLAGIGTLLVLQHQDREMLDNKFRVLAVGLADQQTRIEALQQTHDAALKQLGASITSLQSLSDQIGALSSKEETSRIAQAIQNVRETTQAQAETLSAKLSAKPVPRPLRWAYVDKFKLKEVAKAKEKLAPIVPGAGTPEKIRISRKSWQNMNQFSGSSTSFPNIWAVWAATLFIEGHQTARQPAATKKRRNSMHSKSNSLNSSLRSPLTLDNNPATRKARTSWSIRRFASLLRASTTSWLIKLLGTIKSSIAHLILWPM